MSPRPLIPSDIAVFAPALAAMDPWRRLGFTASGLAAYLGREDPALTRMVMAQDGVAVAVLALRNPWLRGPSIELLAVLPAGQGGGIRPHAGGMGGGARRRQSVGLRVGLQSLGPGLLHPCRFCGGGAAARSGGRGERRNPAQAAAWFRVGASGTLIENTEPRP